MLEVIEGEPPPRWPSLALRSPMQGLRAICAGTRCGAAQNGSSRIISGWFDAVGQRLFDRRCPFSLLAGSGPHPLGVTDPIKCETLHLVPAQLAHEPWSRVPWNLGGGPGLIRLRPHCSPGV